MMRSASMRSCCPRTKSKSTLPQIVSPATRTLGSKFRVIASVDVERASIGIAAVKLQRQKWTESSRNRYGL